MANYKKCEVCNQLAAEDALEEVTIVMTKHVACPITPGAAYVAPTVMPPKTNSIEEDLAAIRAVNESAKLHV